MLMSKQVPIPDHYMRKHQYRVPNFARFGDGDDRNTRNPVEISQNRQQYTDHNRSYGWWAMQPISQSNLHEPMQSPALSEYQIDNFPWEDSDRSETASQMTMEHQLLPRDSWQSSEISNLWPQAHYGTHYGPSEGHLPESNIPTYIPSGISFANTSAASYDTSIGEPLNPSQPQYQITHNRKHSPVRGIKIDSRQQSPARNLPNRRSLEGRSPTQLSTSRHLPSNPRSPIGPSFSVYPLSKVRSNWTQQEDMELLAAVERVKQAFEHPLPWSRVAESLEGRTSTMCSKRYKQIKRQISEPSGPTYTRGPWTPEEDADLLATIEECRAMSRVEGLPLPWTKIGSMLKLPRSGLQVCARYTEALDPSIIRGRWTKEEDVKLLAEVSRLNGRWSLICQEIPGRTQRQCASRYSVLKGKGRSS